MCIKFAVIGNSRIFATLLKQEVIGRLAQLVQSICLTSRGSAVRIRQRPPPRRKIIRAFSSAGSEHLPYKQRVGGSNPSTPTPKYNCQLSPPYWAFSSAGSEHLPYKQRVGGSNPSTPTSSFAILRSFLFLISFLYANIDSGR